MRGVFRHRPPTNVPAGGATLVLGKTDESHEQAVSRCESGRHARVGPIGNLYDAYSEAFKERTAIAQQKRNEAGIASDEALEFYNRLKEFAFAGQDGTATAPAPACRQQAPMASIYGDGSATIYQRTFEQTGR